MENYEDEEEPDINEQIFHNNVREQIVSFFQLLFFIFKILFFLKVCKHLQYIYINFILCIKLKCDITHFSLAIL